MCRLMHDNNKIKVKVQPEKTGYTKTSGNMSLTKYLKPLTILNKLFKL